MRDNSSHRLWNVILYGDVDLNIIDGSAIWLVSLAEVLAQAGCRVRVQLKAPVKDGRLLTRLASLKDVTLIQPPSVAGSDRLSPRYAARAIASLNANSAADVIIVRGLQVCAHVVLNDVLRKKLWAYVTDLPRLDLDQTSSVPKSLRDVSERASRLLAQTEDARSLLEAALPSCAGRVSLMPPMIPDPVEWSTSDRGGRRGEPWRLIYSGKMAKAWNTLETIDLPSRIYRDLAVDSVLEFVGDKVQDDRRDTGWADRMREALEDARKDSRVSVLGGLSRDAALGRIAAADFGLSWRDASLDSSLEISTKVLEYSSRGVLPILNDTQAHRNYLGDRYPGLVDSGESPIDAIARMVAMSEEDRAALRTAVREASRYHWMSAASERFRAEFLSRVRTAPKTGARLLVASHDLKFADDVMSAIDSDGYQFDIDRWASLRQHDSDLSSRLLANADVVFCEWAGPNAVWYSQHVRNAQKLFVRFHGFEIRGPWLDDIDLSRVEKVVFVSEYIRRRVVEELGWPERKTCVIKNSVDVLDMARPKVPDAQYHLGILGIVPALKRPDRALDLLEALLEHDDRYVLHVKGRPPWNYGWEWREAWQRDAYFDMMRRARSRSLMNSVIFEEFSPDVASWMRGIGWVLSPSAYETFHLAAAEGMASGAVPVIWERPGAEAIFGTEWTVSDTSDAVSRVLSVNRFGHWAEYSGRAARYARCEFSLADRIDDWVGLFSGSTIARIGTGDDGR